MNRGGRYGGGRGNSGRGGRRQGNNSGGRGGGRRRHGRGGRDRQSADSGNRNERIAVESGQLVLIDQFMLANPQLVEMLVESIDEDASVKRDFVAQYGGSVVEVEPGTYRIERDPYAYTIVIHPEGDKPEVNALSERATNGNGFVFVDTRCLAMVDRELLDDGTLLQKYQQLWFSGQDKACRDLLRDNGGAVRYGFRRFGDELGIYLIPDENVVCLWPDVAEPGIAAVDE